MSQKLHVKTGDTVVVISGKDKGKQGKITAALPKKGRVVVEGVNVVKRHTKPTQANRLLSPHPSHREALLYPLCP